MPGKARGRTAPGPAATLELLEDEHGDVQVLLFFRPALDEDSWAHYFATVGLAAIRRAMEEAAAREGGNVTVCDRTQGRAGTPEPPGGHA